MRLKLRTSMGPSSQEDGDEKVKPAARVLGCTNPPCAVILADTPGFSSRSGEKFAAAPAQTVSAIGLALLAASGLCSGAAACGFEVVSEPLPSPRLAEGHRNSHHVHPADRTRKVFAPRRFGAARRRQLRHPVPQRH